MMKPSAPNNGVRSSPSSGNMNVMSSGNSVGSSGGGGPGMMSIRSESMAYPKSTRTNSFMTKVQFYGRQNFKAMLASAAFLVFVFVITSDAIHDSAGPGVRTNSREGNFLRGWGGTRSGITLEELEHWGGAIHGGSFNVADSYDTNLSTPGSNKEVYHFATVTDLDQLSLVKDKSKPTFQSILLPGMLTRNTIDNTYEIQLQNDQRRTLITNHNEAGRGAEFSELTIYNNRLLTFDDRTGDVFEIINTKDGTSSSVVPRFVITEGEGDTDKGMKWEWATVKDDKLYMGSMGKEYTNKDGQIVNTNNQWIGILDGKGHLKRVDWKEKYNFVRKALGASAPGYIIMEAILWSDHWNQWIFLPRRISSTAYDDVIDEKMGGRKIIMVDEHFTKADVIELKGLQNDGLRGFSSFAFVPNTMDRHAIAIRSVEEDCTGDLDVCKQRSYVVVFDVKTGEVLTDEVQLSADMKFEGIEFVNIHKSNN